MSHVDQLQFFRIARSHFPEFFTGTRVLEVGSLDINGSVRSFFSPEDYVGIDVGEGPGVDLVVPGQQYAAPDGSFDVVVSAECMEHNPAWEATTRNMVRLLRPGGLLLLTCAAPGRPEHGTTRTSPLDSPLTVATGQEYYQNLDQHDFESTGALTTLRPRSYWMNWGHRDLYIAALKGGGDTTAWKEYIASMDEWIDGLHTAKPVPRLERAILRHCGRGTYERLLPAIGFPKRLVAKVRYETASRR